MDINNLLVEGLRELKAAHMVNSHAQIIGQRITLRITAGSTRMVHCAPTVRSVMKRLITVPLTNNHTSVRNAVPADDLEVLHLYKKCPSWSYLQTILFNTTPVAYFGVSL
jgi:hypothetical protein